MEGSISNTPSRRLFSPGEEPEKEASDLAATSQKTRVLFLTPYFRPYLGGIERAIEGLASEFLASPEVEKVGVLTGKYAFPRVPHPDWPDRETTSLGIDILRLSSFPLRSLPIYSVPLVWFPPRQIRRYVKEFDPTVIHFVGDGWFWGHLWAWLWGRTRATIVFTPSFHTLPLERQWLRLFNIPLCQVVDKVVALTEMEKDRVRRAYRIPESKLSIIGWGVKPPEPQKVIVAGASGQSTVRILCVGRLGDHKGQMWLLEVFRKARQQFQSPARLVLVGRDEGRELDIRRAVKDWDLEEEVLITGETTDEELEDWYARSDIFVLFSKYEAFGLVFFEAMANGLPVLTHDVGANRELLTRGSVVVGTDNSDEAAQELVNLVNDADGRKKLGEDGRDYAVSQFSWPVVANKYLELYHSAR